MIIAAWRYLDGSTWFQSDSMLLQGQFLLFIIFLSFYLKNNYFKILKHLKEFNNHWYFLKQKFIWKKQILYECLIYF